MANCIVIAQLFGHSKSQLGSNGDACLTHRYNVFCCWIVVIYIQSLPFHFRIRITIAIQHRTTASEQKKKQEKKKQEKYFVVMMNGKLNEIVEIEPENISK